MSGSNNDKVQQFLNQVKDQIRSKEAKRLVERELQSHIRQKKSTLLNQGIPENVAVTQIINQMGNPVTLGKEMHKIHKPKVDWLLIGLFTIVLLFGTVPFYYLSFEEFGTIHQYFNKQLVVSGISILIVISLMLLDYRIIRKLWPWLLCLALFLTIIMFLSSGYLNGRKHVFMGSFAINYWFISLIYILSYAGMLTSSLKGVKLSVATNALFWVPIFFFLHGGYIPVAFFYFVTGLCMILFLPLPKKQLKQFFIVKSFILALTLPVFFLSLYPHQKSKLFIFLNPYSDPQGSGYMNIKLQELLKQSTLWGSKEMITGLPPMHSEFIFAYQVYYFGWVFGILLIIFLMFFLIRLIFTVKQTREPLGLLIVISGVMMIGIAAVWNIGMVLGILPIIGVPLPFISYGGQFVVIYSVYIGLILSVYRRKDLVQAEACR